MNFFGCRTLLSDQITTAGSSNERGDLCGHFKPKESKIGRRSFENESIEVRDPSISVKS